MTCYMKKNSTVQQVSLRNDWLTQTADDSCGEGYAQLDDFKWFLPADERARDKTAPESEIEVSDSESEVEYIEPDSTLYRQRRRHSSCYALRWSLRRDLWRAVSAASDTVVSQKIHRKSECVPTVVPMLAAGLRPPPRLFSRDLEITAAWTYFRRWASV